MQGADTGVDIDPARSRTARFGLHHPTWLKPECFFYHSAEEARAAAERTYGPKSGHVVVGPVDELLGEIATLRGQLAFLGHTS